MSKEGTMLKKLVLAVVLALTFMTGAFAKTQTVYCYKYQQGYTLEPHLTEMIGYGWSIVSITPVIRHTGTSSTTDYIIVVYEKE